MSDPKDKLALMKEVLSLCVVLIGFITALISSGALVALKSVKIDPTIFFIVLAVVLFIVQLILRIMLGEEKYVAARKKVISTARDFAILIIAVAVCYFGGRYAWDAWNAPPAVAEKAAAPAVKKPAAERKPEPAHEARDAKTDAKVEPKPEKKPDKKTASAKKPARDEDEKDERDQKPSAKKTSRTHAEDQKNADAKPADAKQAKREEKEPPKTASAPPERATATVEVKRPSVKITVDLNSGETQIVRTSPSESVPKVTTVKLPDTPDSVEIKVAKADPKTVSVEIAKVPAPPAEKTGATAPVEVAGPAAPAAEKTAEVENVVINVTAPKPAPAEPEKSTVEVEMPKATEEDPEITVDENNSDTTGATFKLEMPSPRYAEKTDDRTLVVKKEIEPSSIKKAGEKIVEGGSNLLEKAGRGIKKNIDKIKNLGK